jgi:hypothetical protein
MKRPISPTFIIQKWTNNYRTDNKLEPDEFVSPLDILTWLANKEAEDIERQLKELDEEREQSIKKDNIYENKDG